MATPAYVEADIKEDVYGSVISLVASMLFSVNVVDVASAPPQGLQVLMTVLILLMHKLYLLDG